MVGIIDYGVGNLGSVRNILTKLNAGCTLVRSQSDLDACSHLILPGVGSFDYAARNFFKLPFLDKLEEAVRVKGKPILGLCVGAQLMTNRSEEGVEKGLGWLNAEVVRFQKPSGVKKLAIPHMGWNWVYWRLADNPLANSLTEKADPCRFYFVHSYHFTCETDEEIIGTTNYGYSFPSIIGKENIFAVQFHPEKSHVFGFQLFKNFIGISS